MPSERLFYKPNKYLINPENMCPNTTPVDYLFAVYSAVEYVRTRNVIRSTWGKEIKRSSGNKLIFLFGKPNTSDLQNTLAMESLRYGDIVQEDFVDSYRNLTVKTVMMLRWVTLYCPQARFVVKMDDDSFLNVANFYRAMHERPEDAIYGQVIHRYAPERRSENKWYISYDDEPRDVFPDFIAGPMYVIGGRVVHRLYTATGLVKPFPNEDVYLTGKCAERAGVSITHLSGVHFLKLPMPCDYKKAIYVHQVTAEEISNLWYTLNRLEYKCHNLLFSLHICYCGSVDPSTEAREVSLI
ncbi:hypothetical protein V5799_006503 [Amblyomma americanum]|uniref:Hexosyltransferase n=1 Tax=Amblyomma americanum TaxID=6943 RepID=A0AAQ4DW74_AMBAM